MATVHLYLSDRHEQQIKQISEKLGIERPAVLKMALKELHDRLFPPESPPRGTNPP